MFKQLKPPHRVMPVTFKPKTCHSSGTEEIHLEGYLLDSWSAPSYLIFFFFVIQTKASQIFILFRLLLGKGWNLFFMSLHVWNLPVWVQVASISTWEYCEQIWTGSQWRLWLVRKRRCSSLCGNLKPLSCSSSSFQSSKTEKHKNERGKKYMSPSNLNSYSKSPFEQVHQEAFGEKSCIHWVLFIPWAKVWIVSNIGRNKL